MNYKETVGPHTFEFRLNNTGSIDPWFCDILHRYHIGAMCTADIAEFLRLDGKIYKLDWNAAKFADAVKTWKDLYEQMPDEVEKEIDEYLHKYTELKYNREPTTVEECLNGWGISVQVHKLEEIRENLDKYQLTKLTFETAAKVFGELVNHACYLPEENGINAFGFITFDINLPENRRVTIGVENDRMDFQVLDTKNEITETVKYIINTDFRSKEFSKLIEITKKPRDYSWRKRNGSIKKDGMDGKEDSGQA